MAIARFSTIDPELWPGIEARTIRLSRSTASRVRPIEALLSRVCNGVVAAHQSENIGASKTSCIGRLTSFSTRIRRGAEKTMLLPALPLYADLTLNIAQAHPGLFAGQAETGRFKPAATSSTCC